MKDNAHRIMTEEAIKLLPEPCCSFFDEKYLGETALDLVKAGAVAEDYEIDPLGRPKNIPTGGFFESSAWEGAMLDLVTWFKDDKVPWLEHYWSQNFGPTGLDNPVGITGLTFRAAPERAQDYWDKYVLPLWKEGSEASRAQALGYFGRVIHLLQDMGTPAHANNDCHMALDILGMISDSLAAGELGIGTIDDDDFEDFVGERYRDNPDSWPANSMKQFIYYHPAWTLRDFNRRLAEISTLYDSDDVDGRGSGQPYRWDSFLESSDPHRDITFDLTDYACNAIAANLIPMNISFVAGLIIKFLHTIGFEDIPEMHVVEITLKKIRVHDDTDPLAAGEIYINAPAFGKRFGRYRMSSGESREIGGMNSTAFMVYRGQKIGVHFDVFDDDSWYFAPKAKDSLGSVDMSWPDGVWTSWMGAAQRFSVPTSNGRASLDFELQVTNSYMASGGGMKSPIMSMEEIIEAYPPLEFSDKEIDSKIHSRHCHYLKRIEPENLRRLFMFNEEFEEMKQELSRDPAKYSSGRKREFLEKIARHENCKTCERLRKRSGG